MSFKLNWFGVASALTLLVAVFPPLVFAETRSVRRGENLQAVLNAAAAGDVILLEAGAEFVGNFTLPVKAGGLPVVLRSAPSPLLPPDGQRIHPQHAPLLARLRSPNTGAALKTAAGASNWQLRYLEFGPNQNGYGEILQIGDSSAAQNSLDKVPHHFTLDHLYVHGDPLVGQKRCIALHAAHVTIRDSYVADCKGVGFDTQAICGWNGPGPYVIENNYLEGAGENVMFGGADPAIANLVADGITFKGNFVSRPLAWRDPIIETPQQIAAVGSSGGQLPAGTYTYTIVARRHVGMGTIGRSTASAAVTVTVGEGGAVSLRWQPVARASEYRVYRTGGSLPASYWQATAPSFADTGAPGEPGEVPTTKGTVWSVKNLFELKNARNVVVDGNIFENHWKDAQAGYSIVLTPRNSNGSCTWCVVEHVTFENNIVRHVTAGINVLGYDSPTRGSRQTTDLVFRNNLFWDVQGGLFLLMGDEPRDVVVDHNTVSHSGNAFVYAYGGTVTDPREVLGVRITNNAVRHNLYGINGAYFGYGNAVINGFLPGATVAGNFLAGGTASRYPAGNFTQGVFEAEFVDAAHGDFRLRPASQLRGNATDGGDIGADIATLMARLKGVDGVSPVTVKAPVNLRIANP
jgi:hypothetical protein